MPFCSPPLIEKFKQSVGRPVGANVIWDKLRTLYALDMLEETEISPLQEEKEKIHFTMNLDNHSPTMSAVSDSPRFFDNSEFELADLTNSGNKRRKL